MSSLIALFVLGFKRFFCKRNLIVFLIMFLLLLYAVNKGVDDYKVAVEKSREFQKIQGLMFRQVRNYIHYSFFGARYLFIPSASAIFFTESPMMSELSAKVDNTVTIDLHVNCKGSVVFKGNSKGFLRASGLLILLGTLFALFTGYESMCRKEYLKFLSSKLSHLKVFIAVIFSRFILIALTLFVMFVGMLAVVKLRGIELTSGDLNSLWVFMGITLMTMLIFLVIGGIIGTIRSNALTMTLLLGVWIVSVFIIPGGFDSIIEEKADDILTSYKTHLSKLQKTIDFENRTEEKLGKFDRKNMAAERENIEHYWNSIRLEVEKYEETLKGEIAEVIDKYKRLSMLFPTTFYNLTALEVSSRGYENYLAFYSYVQDSQRQFSRFWIDRYYYNDIKEIVSFIKGDEIVFHGKSRIPGNFILGLLIHLFYVVALLVGSYFRFKKWLYTPVDKRSFNEKDREIQLKKDRINVLYSHRPGLREQLYLLFSKKGIKKESPTPSLNVTLESERITGTSINEGFVYICHPSAIPGDIKPADLISFIARTNGVSSAEKAAIVRTIPADCLNGRRFSFLKPLQQAEVLLSILPSIKGKIYLVDQIGKEMPLSILVKLKDQLQTLAKKGALVIYLTPDKRVEAVPTQPEREVLDLPDWFEAVEAHRFLLDEETGKWRTMVRPETEKNR